MISRIASLRRDARFVLLGSIMLAIFLAALDQNIVATAVPSIIGDLGGLRHFSWIFSGYMLASVASTMVIGRLGDIYGRRPVFVGGVLLFVAASALCGLSSSLWQLVLFRALQGVGAGAIMVNSMASIADIFPPAERGKYQGVVGAMFALASIIGPAAGGLITDFLGWHWIFFINIPLGGVVVYVLLRNLPQGRPHAHSLDVSGAALMIASISLLVYGMLVSGSPGWELGSLRLTGFFMAALFLGAVFVYHEMRVAEPILPLYIFRNKVMAVSALCVFLLMAAGFGIIPILPLFFQGVLGFGAAASGFLLVPFTLATASSSAVCGQLVARTGRYKGIGVVGSFFVLTACILLLLVGASSSAFSVVVFTMVLGVGMGASFPVFTIAVQNSFDSAHLGVATSVVQFFRIMGSLFGVTLYGGVMNVWLGESALLGSGQDRLVLASSIHSALVFGVVFAAAAVVAVFFLREERLRKSHDESIVGIGKELAADEGVFGSENEPVLVDGRARFK